MKITVFDSNKCKKTNDSAIKVSANATNASWQRGRCCQQLGRGYEFCIVPGQRGRVFGILLSRRSHSVGGLILLLRRLLHIQSHRLRVALET